MSLPEIDEIRTEHEREGVGPGIYALLRQVVRTAAVRYPPAIYSGSEAWDEGTLEELLQGWLAQRLLRGDLAAMVHSAASARSLRRQLTTSLTQLIVNQRRRDSAGNLYRRTLAMLKEDAAFAQAAAGAPQQAPWTLAGGRAEGASDLPLADLVRVAFELDDDELEVVRYGPHSLKSSPILREPALERFLTHLLGRAGGGLTPARIAEVMQHRFCLVRERSVELDDQLASEDLVDMNVESKALAASAAACLDAAERASLRAIVEADWDFGAAAERTGESATALRATAGRLAAQVAEHAGDPGQAEEVLGNVLESLFVGESDD